MAGYVPHARKVEAHVEFWPEILSEKDITKWDDDDTNEWKLFITAVPVHKLLQAECS
jgi:hypothetical protein